MVNKFRGLEAPMVTAHQQTMFLVLNREGLAEVAAWIIDHKGASWSGVKPELRQLQPTLSRLRNKKLGTISGNVLGHLAKHLGERSAAEQLHTLYSAVVSMDAQQLFRDYLAWLAHATVRYPHLAGGLRRYVQTAHGPEVIEAQDPAPDLTEERLRARQTTFKRLYSDDACAVILHRFVLWMSNSEHEPPRLELALTRVVDPLIEAADAGFIERSIDELSPAELRRFVQAGIVRERILLTRAAGLARAQSLMPVRAAPTSKPTANTKAGPSRHVPRVSMPRR